MATEIPTDIPKSVRAGDTWQWTKSIDDYPATTYTATYYFVKQALTSDKNRYDAVSGSVAGRGTETHSKQATADGTGYAVSITAADSATYRAGRYKWVLKVVKTSDTTIKYTVEEGYIDVLPDVSAMSSSYDERSTAQLIADQCDEAIRVLTLNKHASYTIGDRTFNYQDLAELRSTRSYYKGVARLESGKGLQSALVTFGASS